MHKGLMMVLSWLAIVGTSIAQTDTIVKKPVSEFRLKINPLALLELDGGIGIAGEYIPANSKLAFQIQVQPVFFSIDNAQGEDGFETPVNTIKSGMPTGIKLRPEVRYYFTAKRKGIYNSFVHLMQDVMPFRKRKAPLQTYAAIDFLYKHTQRERQGEFEVNNGGISVAYTQTALYTDIKKVIGFDMKVGAVSALGNSGRWLIEAYLGIGYRQKTYSYKNLPTGAANPERNNLFVTAASGMVENNLPLKIQGLSLPAGLQLIYRL